MKSVLNKEWSIREIPIRLVESYMRKFDLSEIEARLIALRGIEEDRVNDFLDPKLRNLIPDPFHLLDMDKAVTRIEQAIELQEKICIFGDYDVDGATSSALLKRVFLSLGITPDVYIPDRMKDGYGPSPIIMQKLHKTGTQLIITVDCGVMAYDAIDVANELGMDVIIIDHHICAETLPKALAVINPNRLDETTQHRHLAAVGVSFLFAIAIVSRLRKNGFFENGKNPPNLMDLLDIVALGTVCDVMPLTGLNRAFVSQGLKVMAQRKNIGLRALADVACIDAAPSTYHLGYVLGPRINAGGRVGESNLGSKLLCTDCEIDAMELAQKLEEFNVQRRLIEVSIVEEALATTMLQAKDNCIMASGNWHPGVIGIVAGRLKEAYNRPSVAIAVQGGIAKASCRSIPGIDFGLALAEAKLQGLIDVGGGHAMAAGFTTTEQKLPALKSFLEQEFGKHQDKIATNLICEYDLEVASSGVSVELFHQISRLAPFGNGNKEPLIMVTGLYVLKAYVVGEKHISCLLATSRDSYQSKALRAIAFNAIGTRMEQALFSQTPLNIAAIGSVKLYHKNGEDIPQMVITDVIAQ